MSKDFYYQIKGLATDQNTGCEKWSWPPLFSGKVEAANSKEARAALEGMFKHKLPGSIKRADFSQPFLMRLTEITDDQPYLKRLFELKECEECGNPFRQIDLYNDPHETYKGPRFCCQVCANKAKAAEIMAGPDDPYGNKSIPCIYRITNKRTKMVYIGQTTQAFTLRWWQHIKWGESGCKFHQAMRNSELTDWTFEVLEVCKAEELDQREAYHIAAHDSVERGYNSLKGVKSAELEREAV